jgi:hypothetical protein
LLSAMREYKQSIFDDLKFDEPWKPVSHLALAG